MRIADELSDLVREMSGLYELVLSSCSVAATEASHLFGGLMLAVITPGASSLLKTLMVCRCGCAGKCVYPRLPGEDGPAVCHSNSVDSLIRIWLLFR